jgi:hypothetical protein
MNEQDRELSPIDKFLAGEAKEKPPEQATARLREVTSKIMHLAEQLNYNGSRHERVVYLLLMAARQTAHAGSDQEKNYRSEALNAAHLNVQQALKEFGSL